jgi:mycothione reductase
MRHYDSVALGAGSGNTLLNEEFDHLQTAIVEPDRFGGTYLNRGCIPSLTALRVHPLGRAGQRAGAAWVSVRSRSISSRSRSVISDP